MITLLELEGEESPTNSIKTDHESQRYKSLRELYVETQECSTEDHYYFIEEEPKNLEEALKTETWKVAMEEEIRH